MLKFGEKVYIITRHGRHVNVYQSTVREVVTRVNQDGEKTEVFVDGKDLGFPESAVTKYRSDVWSQVTEALDAADAEATAQAEATEQEDAVQRFMAASHANTSGS